ncbi:hypothetical protein ACWEN6_25020 [Sphaerisporangium sp. NPDC004334]
MATSTTDKPATGYLTRDQILAADDRVYEDVPVPQWGGTVRVRSLTGRERDKFEAGLLDKSGAPRVLGARAKLAQLSMVDERGQLVFGEEDVRALSLKSAAALQQVFETAQRLSGLTDKDMEELEGE